MKDEQEAGPVFFILHPSSFILSEGVMPSPGADACPTHQDLAAFDRGDLPAPALDAIGAHLALCPRCLGRLQTSIAAPDELLSALRSLDSPADEEDPDVQREMNRLVADGPAAHPSRAAADLVPPPAQVRGYRLLGKLGEGGMGTVYRAQHSHLNRPVALKMLAGWRTRDPGAVARFRREMKVVGLLNHPNIVRAFDAGEADGMMYLVMELIEGADLTRLVRRHARLSVADACEMARQAALALEHAHAHGLVHRDIKPSNLMLANSGQVKLLDLGLARLQRSQSASGDTTGSDLVVGSFDYMAPEQADDPRAVDGRADLYGLGCTLYHVLTGRPPFGGPEYANPRLKMDAHARAAPPPLGSIRPDIPAELAALLDRLLAKDPAERPGGADEVATTLTPLATGSDLLRLRPGTEDELPGTRDEGRSSVRPSS